MRMFPRCILNYFIFFCGWIYRVASNMQVVSQAKKSFCKQRKCSVKVIICVLSVPSVWQKVKWWVYTASVPVPGSPSLFLSQSLYLCPVCNDIVSLVHEWLCMQCHDAVALHTRRGGPDQGFPGGLQWGCAAAVAAVLWWKGAGGEWASSYTLRTAARSAQWCQINLDTAIGSCGQCTMMSNQPGYHNKQLWAVHNDVKSTWVPQ